MFPKYKNTILRQQQEINDQSERTLSSDIKDSRDNKDYFDDLLKYCDPKAMEEKQRKCRVSHI